MDEGLDDLASRSARSADPAAARRLSVPRQSELPSFSRSRRQRSEGGVHGRLSGAVGVGALSGAVAEPAWRSKPSWYLVATEEKMIPPPTRRQMATRAAATVAEAAGSHAIHVSNPEAVAALIASAAKSVGSRMAA